jgi:hypothetical protein
VDKSVKSKIRRRIFLVGCPRSGTTLLQTLIAAHPDITSFPETQFFSTTFGYSVHRSAKNWTQEVKTRLRYFVDRYPVKLGFASHAGRRRTIRFLNDIGCPQLKRLLPMLWFLPKWNAESFVTILDTLATEEGRTIWLEKSPNHLYHIETIEKYVPDVLFIHMLRNGADVVASLYDAARKYPDKQWGRNYGDINQCIAQWNAAVQVTQKYLSNERHLVVTYERFLVAQRQVLDEICRFVGVDFDEAMLVERDRAVQRLVLKNEPWKANVAGAAYNMNQTKFYELFDEGQREYILSQLMAVATAGFSR